MGRNAGSSVLVRANAWSETADPEGRQAEWNGALLRSKIKKGPRLPQLHKKGPHQGPFFV